MTNWINQLVIPNPGVKRSDEMISWCMRHFGQPTKGHLWADQGAWNWRTVGDRSYVSFKNEDDAMLFKLIWL